MIDEHANRLTLHVEGALKAQHFAVHKCHCTQLIVLQSCSVASAPSSKDHALSRTKMRKNSVALQSSELVVQHVAQAVHLVHVQIRSETHQDRAAS